MIAMIIMGLARMWMVKKRAIRAISGMCQKCSPPYDLTTNDLTTYKIKEENLTPLDNSFSTAAFSRAISPRTILKQVLCRSRRNTIKENNVRYNLSIERRL